MHITDSQLEPLIADGFVLIPGFLDPAELSRSRAEAGVIFPDGGGSEARTHSFPFHGDALNHNAVHPDLLDTVERILGTTGLRVGHSVLGCKRHADGHGDQPLHVDYYGQNSITFPRDGIYRQLVAFIYYTDVSLGDGPTYVVPKRHSRGTPLVPPMHPRSERPELYRHESPLVCQAGSLLLFDMATFHRGSAITSANGCRIAQCTTFGAASCPWLQGIQFATTGASDATELRRFMERATPRQREAIGFPPLGHDYWNDETIAGVSARYPGMDMQPYRSAAMADACPSRIS